jgi:hypothetical protein
MAMVYGDLDKILQKFIKVIIVWIKNLDMEFINGKMDGYIKETFKMIIEMDLVNCMMVKSLIIVVIGKMANKQINKSLTKFKIVLKRIPILIENHHLKFTIDQVSVLLRQIEMDNLEEIQYQILTEMIILKEINNFMLIIKINLFLK